MHPLWMQENRVHNDLNHRSPRRSAKKGNQTMKSRRISGKAWWGVLAAVCVVCTSTALLYLVEFIPLASAHNSAGVSPPPECSKFVPGDGNTSHSTSVT